MVFFMCFEMVSGVLIREWGVISVYVMILNVESKHIAQSRLSKLLNNAQKLSMNLIVDPMVFRAYLPVCYLLHVNFFWLTLSLSLHLNIVMNQIILVHVVLSSHLVVDFPPLHWWESTVSTSKILVGIGWYLLSKPYFITKKIMNLKMILHAINPWESS